MRRCPGQSTKKWEIDACLLQLLVGKANERRWSIERWCPIGEIEEAICTMLSLGDRIPVVRSFRGITNANALLALGCAYLLPCVRFTV